MFLNTHNLIHNNNVKIHRYVIDRGEAVVTFDLSFARFNLVLDFKYLNCCGVKIDNHTQNSTIEKWSDFKSVCLRIRSRIRIFVINIYRRYLFRKPPGMEKQNTDLDFSLL
jgi:hypothetical protein